MKLSLITAFVLIAVACSSSQADLETQSTAADYLSENGLILNYKNAKNPQYLSESLGLYMQYLLGTGDYEGFRRQVDIFLEHFAVFKGDHKDDYLFLTGNPIQLVSDTNQLNGASTDAYLFVKWEIGENTTVGALIDDLRIAWVLHAAGLALGDEYYIYLSDMIISTIKEFMIVDDRLVDFFDWHYNIAKDQLFLSYYIIEAMGEDVGDFPHYVFEPLEALVADPFFDEIYENGRFLTASEHEVNMIDQSLIAIAYFRHMGFVEPNFQRFLEDTLSIYGRVYARYDRHTAEPVNDNQSSATYAFLLHYFELTGQDERAAVVRALLEAMQTYDPETTHFFDFINRELGLRGLFAS